MSIDNEEYDDKTIDLDIDYRFELLSRYDEFEIKAQEIFKENTGKKNYGKRNQIAIETIRILKEVTMLPIDNNNWYEDSYAIFLINHYKEHIHEFEEDRISLYLKEYLPKIKKEAPRTSYPVMQYNFNRDESDTVVLIARWNAANLFLERVNTINEEDSLEICLKKISFEGYTIPSIPKEPEIIDTHMDGNDTNQAARLKYEFTTARQVLAMHYLFEFAGIKKNQCDLTKKANFIRFLLGKELGAKKIGDTNIYSCVKKPLKDNDKERDKDLKYIREFFLDMDLVDIVKEIDNDLKIV